MTEGESRRWYSRSDIARELEVLAGKLLRQAVVAKDCSMHNVGSVILEHVDSMRADLGEQAEREARDDIKRREAAGEFVPSHYDAYRQENS